VPLFPILTVLALTVPPSGTVPPRPAPADSSYDAGALFRDGADYATFRDAATRRVSQWRDTYANAVIADALRTRVERLPSTWNLLVVADDGCSDSAASIPWIARLADATGNLSLRIVRSGAARPLLETHRTPDGRAATPTILVLDSELREVGCWIERPAPLQAWALSARASLTDQEFLREKTAWYETDAGKTTLDEIVTLLESAARGVPACPRR
jgi:hypothetical protein